jgi:hypothetical protein
MRKIEERFYSKKKPTNVNRIQSTNVMGMCKLYNISDHLQTTT